MLDISGFEVLDTTGFNSVDEENKPARAELDTSGFEALDTTGFEVAEPDPVQAAPADPAITPHPPPPTTPAPEEDSLAEHIGIAIKNSPTGFKATAGGLLNWFAKNTAGGRIGATQRTLKRLETMPEEAKTPDEVNKMLLEEIEKDPAAVYGLDIYKEAMADLKANMPNSDPDGLKMWAYDVTMAAIQMGPAIGLGIATKSPNVALAGIAPQVIGQAKAKPRLTAELNPRPTKT